jgi:dihydroorotate dehydrogenase
VSPSTPLGYRLLRSLAFRFQPETAHGMAVGLLRAAGALRLPGPAPEPRLRQRALGLDFGNPVGLAAGFDKNAEAAKSFIFMGLGFAEVGTVTPLAQPGNPRPRMFRYPAQRSLQNALGFNNQGVEALRARLRSLYPLGIPLAINIGKNKATPDESAEDDYVKAVERLEDCCDYFVVNVSSPNTPGLRDLQDAERLRSLIRRLTNLTARSILVKLAPDLAVGEAPRLCAASVEAGAMGVVLCNTTTDYSLLPGARDFGGLSGAVLKRRSFEMLVEVSRALGDATTIVSVGGIETPEDVYRRLRAGATLVELYSAMVFEGPGLIRRLRSGLLELMDRDGIENVTEIIGVDR